jgi:hypothetical protein
MNQTMGDFTAITNDWIDAWNEHDLDRIMSHYSDDIEYVANTVFSRWHKPDGKLQGKEELREHFRLALLVAPQLRFTLKNVFSAPHGYAFHYERENGNHVLNVVELDVMGLMKKAQVFYSGEQK